MISAATELFADRGPAAVSLREVATAADVTLSQIYRHIGNKESLLVAVLAAELATTDGMVPIPTEVELATFLKALFALDGPSTRTRLHARIILDGFNLADLQSRYPGVELATDLLRRTLPEDQARVRAAVLTTFFAGWQLLGRTYLQVTGAEDVTPDRFSEIVAPLLEAMASAPPGPQE